MNDLNDLNAIAARLEPYFAKSDEAHNLASSAFDHSARANGRVLETAGEFSRMKSLLKKCIEEVVGLRAEVKELRGHAGKHAQRLNAHRSRLNALESGPGQPQRDQTPAQFVAKTVNGFEAGTEGRDLLAKADSAIADPNLMVRVESAINRGDLSEARRIVANAEREKMHTDLRKRVSVAPQRVQDEVEGHLDRGDHQAALERVQNHERAQRK